MCASLSDETGTYGGRLPYGVWTIAELLRVMVQGQKGFDLHFVENPAGLAMVEGGKQLPSRESDQTPRDEATQISTAYHSRPPSRVCPLVPPSPSWATATKSPSAIDRNQEQTCNDGRTKLVGYQNVDQENRDDPTLQTVTKRDQSMTASPWPF
jgi:hypothetical protein